MLDQVRIGDNFSLDDFDASMKERSISKPKKKTIKDTVAYSNVTYDFTEINGEAYWEESQLEYVFEIIADTPEELEEKKRKFLGWVMFVQAEELHDPYIQGYHFKATYDDIDIDDSEIEKATITVKFSAYPYMIANRETVYTVTVAAGEEREATLINESAHKIIPTITATAPANIEKDNFSYAIPKGEMYDEAFELKPGDNILKVKNSGTENSTLKISFRAEVM